MYLYIGSNGNVAAISPEDGREIWRTSVSASLLTSHQDVCVLEHEGRVFAGTHGRIVALDGGTGRILWSNDLPGMGYNDVTLSIAGKSVQYVSSHTHTHS